MAFPESGKSQLNVGEWKWHQRPRLDASEGSFDVVTARVGVRLRWNTAFPSVFARARKLNQNDFPGVRLPVGDFWCMGPKENGVENDHDDCEIRWMGLRSDDVLSPSDVDLIISGGDGSGLFALLDMSEEIGTVAVQFPIGGNVYADAVFLPAGASVTNPESGEYQQTTFYLQSFRRSYSGVSIGAGNSFWPTLLQCRAGVRDLDGPALNLANNSSAAAVLVRRANWWPRQSTLDSSGWRLSSLSSNAIRRLGRGIIAKTWRAEFIYTPPWTFTDT